MTVGLTGLFVPGTGPAGPAGPIGPAGSASPSFISWGANSVSSTTTNRYLYPWYDDSLASIAGNLIDYICPVNCTIDKMYVSHNTPGGNGNNIIYTVRKNGVATALTVTIPSTSLSGSDLVDSIIIAAGDLLDIEVTKPLSIGSSPMNIVVTCRITP